MSKIFIRDSLKSNAEVKPSSINRKKSKYVNFRMTPEDNDKLNHKVRMLGLKKQDYITQALLNNKVVTIGNIKSFTNIKKILKDIYLKLTDNTTNAYINFFLFIVISF